VNLLDIGDQCFARISRSPDVFSLWLIFSNGSKQTTPWSTDNQANGMKKVASGEIARFWIVHAVRGVQLLRPA
jgi:hypothetical protein